MPSRKVPVGDLIKVSDTIACSTVQYKVEKIMGSGAFGLVALCHKSSTDQKVALKMIPKDPDGRDAPDDEGIMLKFLMDRGGPHFHIVHWFGSFNFKNNYVHELELLDICLFDLVKEKGPLQMKEIRPIIHQMGSALCFFKRLSIMHTDLKPDNVMMVNRRSKPLQIKIIDFGLAQYEKDILQGTKLQVAPCRAPEIFLGAPYDQAIDMWSTGCIMMNIFLGHMLFNGDNDDEAFQLIVNTVGLPPDNLLFKGRYTHHYLTFKDFRWSFRGSECPVNTSNNLHYHILSEPLNGVEERDRAMFFDLIIGMLKPDPEERIRPVEVLGHPFVTLEHLRPLESDYVSECKKIMNLLPHEDKTEVDTDTDAGPSEEETAPSSHKRPREDEDKIEEESESNLRHCGEPVCVSKGCVPVRSKRLGEPDVKPSTLHNDSNIPPKRRHREDSINDLTSGDSLKETLVQDSEPEPRPCKNRWHSI